MTWKKIIHDMHKKSAKLCMKNRRKYMHKKTSAKVCMIHSRLARLPPYADFAGLRLYRKKNNYRIFLLLRNVRFCTQNPYKKLYIKNKHTITHYAYIVAWHAFHYAAFLGWHAERTYRNMNKKQGNNYAWYEKNNNKIHDMKKKLCMMCIKKEAKNYAWTHNVKRLPLSCLLYSPWHAERT